MAALMVLTVISAEARPPAEQRRWARPEATVVVHGRDRSFGALGDVLASGQELATAPVTGWSFPAGARPGRTVVAADGTVLIATSAMTIGVYDPQANVFTTVELSKHDGAVTDLLVLGDGAVAFTATGAGPVFGVLTRQGGRWRLAAQHPVTGAQPGAEGLHQVARFAGSGHLLVLGEKMSVLKLDGDYRPQVVASYRHPLSQLRFSAAEASTDPTSVAGDERFVVGLEHGQMATHPRVVQEFSYDQAAGAIRPVSAPLLPGHFHPASERSYSFDHAVYDAQGNLWVASSHGKDGGRLHVFARGAAGRRPGSATCPFDPQRPMENYVTTEPGKRQVAGSVCPADFQVLQPKDLPASVGLVADLAGSTVISIGGPGQVFAVRAQGTGAQLTFTVGNLVDVGRKVLPIAPGDLLGHRAGAVDAKQRLWFPVVHERPVNPGAALTQWLVSVELGDLFTPKPIRLSAMPGEVVTVQAERSITTGTELQKLSKLVTEVDSLTYGRPCDDAWRIVGCGYDQAAGDGFVAADNHVFGHRGDPLSYTVEVTEPGTYSFSYQAGAWDRSRVAAIQLAVLGRVITTQISNEGGWRTFASKEDLEFPAGVHTLTITSPEGTAGWFLNSFTLRRL